MSSSALVAAWAIGLFGLGAAAIAAYGVKHRADAGELWRVYATTVAIAAALLVPLGIHPLLFALAAAACAWRCAMELATVWGSPIRGAWREGLAAAALAAAVWGTLDAHIATVLLYWATLLAIVVATPLYVQAFARPPEGTRARALALVFPLLAAAHLARLASLSDGFAWVFVLYATVESQDSAAYLCGRLFGKRLLLPRLSPRKTVAGAICGASFGTLVGSGAAWALLGLPPIHATALALLLVAAGFCGDLYTSALKRGAAVKDFPPIHPAHGGLLDIYDSTLFAAIVLSIALYIIDTWTF